MSEDRKVGYLERFLEVLGTTAVLENPRYLEPELRAWIERSTSKDATIRKAFQQLIAVAGKRHKEKLKGKGETRNLDGLTERGHRSGHY